MNPHEGMSSKTRDSVMTVGKLFDTEQYPIDQPDSAGYRKLVKAMRADLSHRNCVRLRNFFSSDTLKRVQKEAQNLAPGAVFLSTDLNAYFTEPPQHLPETHPLRRTFPRRHGMVRGDAFSKVREIWAAFQSEELLRFISDVLCYQQLHHYRDPFACVNVNVQPPGCEFPWHFDNNDFTVSFGLTDPQAGGVFEYVPNLRSRENENFCDVERVLDGDRSRVHELILNPGDLQLFRGGHTLHRVTAPVGHERQSLLFSYVTDPEDMTSAEKAIRIWGEAHPDHYRARTGKG